MRFKKPVLLYGAGREARSTRAYLAKVAPDVPVYVTVDSGPADIDNTIFIAPDALPDAFMAGTFGLIVKSPGVSLYKPIFDAARAAHIPVTSNLNLWADQYRKRTKVIAITGTKGKTTTATLVHAMLTHSGIDAGLAGNVGTAPLDIADKHKVVVFELSSYQTADMDFAPDIIGLTNLSPEHVDWHGSVERYYTDKLNLLDRKGKFAVAISMQAHAQPRVEAAINNNTRRIMVLNPLQTDALEDAVRTSALKGAHNLANANLAARLALAAGANLDGILAAIAEFKPLPHRLEEHRFGQQLFINDSISTTPEATKAALNAYQGNRIGLIAGGHERQQDYSSLVSQLVENGVTLLICLPVTGARLATAAAAACPSIAVHRADNLDAAMRFAHAERKHFDTLILSPGAPSYNQFKNFEERGAAFVTLARDLFSS